MDKKKYGKYFYYVISVLFLIIGLFGINRLISKADLPFSYSYQNNNISATEHFERINPGDIILTVEGIKIRSLYQLETILDERSTGEVTDIELLREGNLNFRQNVHLVSYYRNFNFILISFLVGLSFWITSVFLIIP